MPRGEQKRAAVLSRKDKRALTAAASDLDAISDSDVERAAAVEARKNRDRELKRKVTATEEDRRLWTASLQMQKQRKNLNWLSWLPFAIHTR
jgi:hypothetical protein